MLEWIISSSVLIAVIIAVRFILKGKISLRLQYALWALALVRLLLPVPLGSSSMSIMNQVENSQVYRDVVEPGLNTPEVNTPGTVATNQPAGEDTVPSAPDNEASPVIIPDNGASVGNTGQTGQNTTDLPETPSVSDTPQPQAAGSIDWQAALRFVWLGGSVLLGAWFLVTNLLFAARVRKNRLALETAHKLPLYICGTVDTPCLFGFFRPAIYLTEDVAADGRIMRHAVEHELTHFRHRDHIWALLRCVCLAIHWYNPLVWWAAILSRNDAELACDESTIRRLGESERAEYGRTLLRLTCEKRTALLTTATTMTGSGKSIKERIALIVHKPKMAVYTLLAVLLIAVIAIACTFTGAKDRPHSFTEWTESLTVADIQLAEVSGEYGTGQVAYTLPEGEYEALCALLSAITDENCSLTKPEGDDEDGYRLVLYRADKLWLFKCLSDGTVGLMFNDEETGAYFGCEDSLLIIECPELWNYIVSTADEKGAGNSDDTSEGEGGTGQQEQLTNEQIRVNALMKTLASLTAEDIKYVSNFIGTDYSDVAVLLNDLGKHRIEEVEHSSHASIIVYLSGGPEEFDDFNDEWLGIFVGGKENIVHILYHSKFGTYLQMYFDYPALYQYVHSFRITDSVLDGDDLELYKDILSARAEHMIEVRNSNHEEGKFLGYEIAAFHQIGSFERDGAAYKVYEWDVAFLTDDTDYPWTMNSVWVDAERRVRSYDMYPYFVVRSDGENEQYDFFPWDIPIFGTDYEREAGYDEIAAYFTPENGLREPDEAVPEQYRDILFARAEETIERHNAACEERGQSFFTGYEILSFDLVDSFSRNGGDYLIYQWEIVFLTDDPNADQRMWGGSPFADDQNRIHLYDTSTYFVVYRENDHTDWEFFHYDLFDQPQNQAYAQLAQHFTSEAFYLTGVREGNATLYTRDGISISIPDGWCTMTFPSPHTEYSGGCCATLVNPTYYPDNHYAADQTLFALYHEYEYWTDGLGWIFSIQRYTEDEYRTMYLESYSRQSVFAKDDAYYYCVLIPTDVQFEGSYIESVRDRLLGGILDDMIERNGWERYSEDSSNSADPLASVSYNKIENGFLYQPGNNSVVAISGGTPAAIPMTGAQATVVRNGREISIEYSWAKYSNALAAVSHSGSYSVVPLTGSDRYLALIFDMGYTYLIDTATGEVRDPLAVLDTAITERLSIINFSADGQYAVISYNSGTACILLNCGTGEITHLPYASDIYSVSGYPLDQTRIMLISVFEVGAPHEVEYSRSIYDITTGELTELPDLYTAKDSSAPNFLCGLDDGKMAYTFDENRYLVIVDQATGERTVTQFKDTDIDRVFYCPDALAGVLCDGVVYIVDYDGTAHAVSKAEERIR